MIDNLNIKLDLIQFLNSLDTELKLPLKPLVYYVELLKEQGYREVEFDTNGWQVDFWLTFSNDNKNLTLSGCLYSSEYFVLTKDSDDD